MRLSIYMCEYVNQYVFCFHSYIHTYLHRYLYKSSKCQCLKFITYLETLKLITLLDLLHKNRNVLFSIQFVNFITKIYHFVVVHFHLLIDSINDFCLLIS